MEKNATFGTGHHGKDETGRSAEIEGYIKQTVEWIYKNMISKPEYVIDLGCDNGFMMQQFKDMGATHVIGVDSYFKDNLFGLDIMREDFTTPILLHRLKKEYSEVIPHIDLVVMNHSLEHTPSPHLAAMNMKLLQPHTVFIAVPHAKSSWAQWDSHLTCWTPEFLVHFMSIYGFSLIAGEQTTFRNDAMESPLVEIWGLFRRIKE